MRLCTLCHERPARQRGLCTRCYQRERYNGRIDQYPATGRYADTEEVLVTVAISQADLRRLEGSGNRRLYGRLWAARQRALQARALLRGNGQQFVNDNVNASIGSNENVVEKRFTTTYENIS